MRRLLAVSLLSMTLALSGISMARADESVGSATEPGGVTSGSADKVAENGAEDSAINQKAAQRGKHIHRHLAKLKIASKQKAAGTDSADKSAKTAPVTTAGDNSAVTTSAGGGQTTDTATTASTKDATSKDTGDDKKTSAAGDRSTTKAAKRQGLHLKKIAAKPAASGAASSTASKKGDVCLGERLASTMLGTIVGTPVNMVRKSMQESVIATKDLVGDTSNKFLLGLGGILGVPGGMVSGVLQAPFVAGYHAWKVSGDEPFSANSVGLGDSDK